MPPSSMLFINWRPIAPKPVLPAAVAMAAVAALAVVAAAIPAAEVAAARTRVVAVATAPVAAAAKAKLTPKARPHRRASRPPKALAGNHLEILRAVSRRTAHGCIRPGGGPGGS